MLNRYVFSEKVSNHNIELRIMLLLPMEYFPYLRLWYQYIIHSIPKHPRVRIIILNQLSIVFLTQMTLFVITIYATSRSKLHNFLFGFIFSFSYLLLEFLISSYNFQHIHLSSYIMLVSCSSVGVQRTKKEILKH